MLRKLTRSIARRFDAALAPTGIKTTQLATLAVLEACGPTRSTDLARNMDVTESTLSRNLRPLMAAAWITVERTTGRRSQQVSLTDAGRLKIREAKRRLRVAQRELEHALGSAHLAALHESIESCLQLLHEGRGKPKAGTK
jgi:DNA-binding MarR family transcriptional regulator